MCVVSCTVYISSECTRVVRVFVFFLKKREIRMVLSDFLCILSDYSRLIQVKVLWYKKYDMIERLD